MFIFCDNLENVTFEDVTKSFSIKFFFDLIWTMMVVISSVQKLRPCVRRNFPNFLISRASEMFGFQSLEIFQKKGIFKLAKFSQKISEKSSEI